MKREKKPGSGSDTPEEDPAIVPADGEVDGEVDRETDPKTSEFESGLSGQFATSRAQARCAWIARAKVSHWSL